MPGSLIGSRKSAGMEQEIDPDDAAIDLDHDETPFEEEGDEVHDEKHDEASESADADGFVGDELDQLNRKVNSND
jgi:hypothetical protein